MNIEMEGIWMEAVMAKFKIIFWHLSGITEENYKKMCQKSQSSDRDLKIKNIPKTNGF
jgi:hypothetical protein